jgi:hypothetical protein
MPLGGLRRRLGGVRQRLDVLDHLLVGVVAGGMLVLALHRHLARQVGHRLARDRVEPEQAPVGAVRGQRQAVVRQHRLHHRRELVEDLAHVEDGSHGQQQLVQDLEAAAALRVQVPQALVLEGQAQQVGDRAEGGLVVGGERLRPARAQPHEAGDLLAPQDWRHQARPPSLLLHRAVRREARIENLREVVDALGTAAGRPQGRGEVGETGRVGPFRGAAGERVELERVRALEALHDDHVEGEHGGRGFGDAREDLLELQGRRDDSGDAAEHRDHGVTRHARILAHGGMLRRRSPFLRPRGLMPVPRDLELAQAQGNVRALVLELLAQLAARAAVEELLAPIEGLALFHLELRQQRRKEHGLGHLGHFEDLAFSARSLPEEPLQAEIEAGEQEHPQVGRIDAVSLSRPGGEGCQEGAERLAQTVKLGRGGKAGAAGAGLVTTAAGFRGEAGGGAGAARERQPVVGMG